MADSRTYSFNSVGETDVAYRARTTSTAESTPIGIKTPLEAGLERDGIFKMHRSIDDTISDNFRNLVLTNHGERLFRYDFGANLREIAFELGTEEGDFEAINRIREAVRKFLPYINLQTFETVKTPSTYESPSKVGIKVTYSVPALNPKQRLLEVYLTSVT